MLGLTGLIGRGNVEELIMKSITKVFRKEGMTMDPV